MLPDFAQKLANGSITLNGVSDSIYNGLDDEQKRIHKEKASLAILQISEVFLSYSTLLKNTKLDKAVPAYSGALAWSSYELNIAQAKNELNAPQQSWGFTSD